MYSGCWYSCVPLSSCHVQCTNASCNNFATDTGQLAEQDAFEIKRSEVRIPASFTSKTIVLASTLAGADNSTLVEPFSKCPSSSQRAVERPPHFNVWSTSAHGQIFLCYTSCQADWMCASIQHTIFDAHQIRKPAVQTVEFEEMCQRFLSGRVIDCHDLKVLGFSARQAAQNGSS